MSSSGTLGSTGSGAERRRYARQPIRLDALISIQGQPAFPCVVRDFCVAGIFVALGQKELAKIASQSSATLYFSLIVDGKHNDYQLGLTIFRVVGGGIGCGFDNPDPQVVSLLQNLANASSASVPHTPEEFRETQSGFSPKFLKVKQPLIELVGDSAKEIVSEFIRVADDGLFVAARDAGNNAEEMRFRDGQNEFKGRRSSLEKDIPELMRKGVEILNSPVGISEESPEESGLSELSLIDKDDFEEFLTVSELISVLEPKFKEQIFALEKRFSYLANREIDENTNPIGPQVLCNIFAESLKNLQSERAAINNIYRSLSEVLERGLPKLYDRVNQLLVQYDVVPVIEKDKPGIKKKPNVKRPGGSSPNAQTNPENSESTQDFSQTWNPGAGPAYAPSAAPGHAGPVVMAGSAPAMPPSSVGVQPASGYRAGTSAPNVHAGTVSSQPAIPAQVAPSSPGVVMPGQVGASPPGSVAPGQGIPGPGVPGQAPPAMDASGQVTVGSAPMHEATFGGFIGAPAVYATPSLQQAYSTAQTQLALRRQVAPQVTSESDTVDLAGPGYQTQQIVQGLTDVQQSMVGQADPGMLDVQSIKQKIANSIKAAGGGDGHIGQAESDAIEVIANLFKSLISDTYLTDAAKSNISRLQAPVHKVALMDTQFFETTNHPVRQVLNRVALVDDANDDEGAARNAQVAQLIDQVNAEFTNDVNVFKPVVDELDVLLRDQHERYEANVEEVVQASIEQQNILRQRRDKNLAATDTIGAQKELPAEWNKWLDRVRALNVNDRMIMNANSSKPYPVTLVWIGEEHNPYVFVDKKGHKASTLTMQQVAMYLRRGTLKQQPPDSAGAVDRALFDLIKDMHGDVEEHATKDESTDFLNRKSFVQAIERHLPEKAKKGGGAVLCQISLDGLKAVNDRYGTETGDLLLAKVAEVAKEQLAAKHVIFGRIGGTDLGVYWTKGGVTPAYKKLQACFEHYATLEIEKGEDKIAPKVAAGVTSVEDSMTTPEELLEVIREACDTAKSSTENPIYIAGSENKFREKLEQMVKYVGKAIDRERLVFLVQKVQRLGERVEMPAAHVVVSAEDRNGKIVPPVLFAQALESSERAFDVDLWVIKQSLAWIRDHENVLKDYSAVIIPLSMAAVRRDDLANVIVTELMETAVPPGRIAFEVADKDVVSNLTEVADMMRTLTEFGCRFILDEFGSGQDNYDYLKELAADFVTIQSAYIRDAAEDTKDFAMAKSINELAHFMGKRTIAKRERGKDVESVLVELGVDFMFDQSRSSRVELANV